MGHGAKILGILCLTVVAVLAGCITEVINEGPEASHGSGKPNAPIYRIGELMGGVPEEFFTTTFDQWKREDPRGGRVDLRFHVIIRYHGKTESEDDAGSYFRQVENSLSVVGGEYEFDMAMGDLSSYWAEWTVLLPEESVSGWIEFSVPDWFEPTDLVGKRDDKVLWQIRLVEPSEEPSGQSGSGSSSSDLNNPSITLSGPRTADTGDAIVLSIKNSGNLNLWSWSLDGPGLAAESEEILAVGSQRSFAIVLTGPGPWTYTGRAETYDGLTCSDILVVKKG